MHFNFQLVSFEIFCIQINNNYVDKRIELFTEIPTGMEAAGRMKGLEYNIKELNKVHIQKVKVQDYVKKFNFNCTSTVMYHTIIEKFYHQISFKL